MENKQFCEQGHDLSIPNSKARSACRLCKNEQQRKWYVKNPQKRNQYSWRYIGILNIDKSLFTPIDFDRAYQIQQGCCKICKKHSSEFQRQLHVDHNHKTKFFRDLLCSPCNTRLGLKEDNRWSELDEQYLEAHNAIAPR